MSFTLMEKTSDNERPPSSSSSLSFWQWQIQLIDFGTFISDPNMVSWAFQPGSKQISPFDLLTPGRRPIYCSWTGHTYMARAEWPSRGVIRIKARIKSSGDREGFACQAVILNFRNRKSKAIEVFAWETINQINLVTLKHKEVGISESNWKAIA